MRFSNARFSRSLSLTLALLGLLTPLVAPASFASRASGSRGASRAEAAARSAAAPTQAAQMTSAQAQAAYAKLPLQFEANQGQTDAEVDFITRAGGATVFLTRTGPVSVLRLADESGAASGGASLQAGRRGRPEAETSADAPRMAVLRMKLEGANSQPAVSGLDELEGKVNYFIGDDSEKWRTNIPTFGRVRYASVYEGVDMAYYGNGQRQLEYDFEVRPGTDYRQIALSFEGADKVEVEAASGALLLQVGETTLRQPKPVVYQKVDGERLEIESGYEIKGGGRVGFAVGEYDAARPLIIDPVLAYSTYLGGSSDDFGNGIAVDAAGNAYVTGQTASTNFPTANPIQATYGGGFSDAFVTKLNAAGSALVYSTYLGGNSSDLGTGIAVDAAGNAYVTGFTASTNFPTANAIQATNGVSPDAFVTKLNAAGSALVYSTYLGGNGSDAGLGIAVDAAGNAYVTGQTGSTNFPTANPIQATYGSGGKDVFVTKLNAAGSALVYSTYLGGSSPDFGNGIAVDTSGNAYVTGQTESSNFPTANAFQGTFGGDVDVFVTKLNAAGSALVYSTYLGGGGNDNGSGIAVDSAGNAYVTGDTDSTNFPTANAIQGTNGGSGNDDAFVTKLNAAGSALVYSTYLGGGGGDFGKGIAVDMAGNAYVIGRTGSTNFPTANPIQATNGGGGFSDAFVTKLNAAGSALVYSTYLGGGDGDVGNGIAVDAAGNAYVIGSTGSTNFPTTSEAFQPGKDAGFSVFVSKIGSYVIGGRVIDSGGAGIASVTVTLSGANSAITTTDAGGNFIFLDTTPNGNFTVTPFLAGFTFSPENITISNLNSNQDLLFIGSTPGATPTPTPTPSASPTPATFGFSATSFSAGEGAGSAQIIVTRSGDTAAAATVDYATTDGTANDRGDYSTAIGRLSFGAGETAKSFNVFVTDDAYAEGNETVNITLSSPSAGGQVGGSGSVILTIVDNDAAPSAANPIDSTQFFVRQHYVDFLNREPDAAGLAFWINNIESCGANANCRAAKRVDTSAAFFLSIEFQETGFLVHRATRASFNRLSRYREFVRDSQEIGRGVVIGQPGAEAQLEANKQAFATEFVTRAEFTAIYGGLSNEQYVDALNANTGGSLSQSERDALVAGLNSMTETRATVLRKVADDADFKAREANPAFVLMQYFGYLRRNPDDAPDTNFDGFNFWLQKLNSFGGDFRRADMVKAFITSSEFRVRFGT